MNPASRPTADQPPLDQQLIQPEPCPGCGSTDSGERIGHADPSGAFVLFWSCDRCLTAWPRGFSSDRMHHLSITGAEAFRARLQTVPEDPPW